jgi:hypothetical protein
MLKIRVSQYKIVKIVIKWKHSYFLGLCFPKITSSLDMLHWQAFN